MPLAASGEMSLGGSTSGRSVNLELGFSATALISMNDTAVRTLAAKTTPASAILMSDFYSKSSLPAIGASYQGGFYAGQISTSGNGVPTHNLVVAPVSSGQAQRQWKTSDDSTAGTTSVIDGPTNSANMNNPDHPAAQFCEGLSIGGYTDWYMPAKNELEVLYYNLKPTTYTNNTSSGTNTNAVPSRGFNYTSGTPQQTSSTDFRDTGTEDFTDSRYWSSTEYSSTDAWHQYFNNGNQVNAGFSKSFFGYVRAIRRVSV